MPPERQGLIFKFRVGGTKGYTTWGLFEDGSPGELFLRVSKAGSTIDGLLDSFGILTSIALQHGVPLQTIVGKMVGSRFEPHGLTDDPTIHTASSILDYIFRHASKRFLSGGMPEGDSGMLCQECGNQAVFEEGCLHCESCGWSKC